MERIQENKLITSNFILATITLAMIYITIGMLSKGGDNIALFFGWAISLIFWELSNIITNKVVITSSGKNIDCFIKLSMLKSGGSIVIIAIIILTQWISPLYFAIGFMLTYAVLLIKYSIEFYIKTLKFT